MLYSVNKPTMRQRLDLKRSQNHRINQTAPSVRMMVVAAAHEDPPVVAPLPAPVVKPEPQPSLLKGILNGLI